MLKSAIILDLAKTKNKELSRLSNAFGIGVIKLKLEDTENSNIIISAKRKDTLDIETINKIFEINNDFRVFIESVLNSINIRKIETSDLDKLKTLNDLKKSIEKAIVKGEIEKDNEIEDIVVNNESNDINENTLCCSLTDSFTNTKPIKFVIEDSFKAEVTIWKDILIKTCEYLIKLDESKFMEMALKNKIKGKKRMYFANKQNILHSPRSINNKVYVESNLSTNNIRNILIQLLNEFKIDIDKFKIYIKND